MTNEDFAPRLFADDDAIARIGHGLLAHSLPRADWTHEAHLAACTWLVIRRADIVLEHELPAIIRSYNEAVGGVNDDTQGYHETLTQLYIAGVRAHVAETPARAGLTASVNALLASPRGRRDWPMHYYSPERLFSVTARRYFVVPDRCGFADAGVGRDCRPRVAPMPMEDKEHGHA
jgi:hypothetical protein